MGILQDQTKSACGAKALHAIVVEICLVVHDRHTDKTGMAVCLMLPAAGQTESKPTFLEALPEYKQECFKVANGDIKGQFRLENAVLLAGRGVCFHRFRHTLASQGCCSSGKPGGR